MFPDCDANLVILVKSFVGVRLCLSEPDKEGEGAPGQPCYITFENPDQGSVIQIAGQGSVIRIKYEESDREVEASPFRLQQVSIKPRKAIPIQAT